MHVDLVYDWDRRRPSRIAALVQRALGVVLAGMILLAFWATTAWGSSAWGGSAVGASAFGVTEWSPTTLEESLAVYDSSRRDRSHVLCSMLDLDGSADHLTAAGLASDPTGGGELYACGWARADTTTSEQVLLNIRSGSVINVYMRAAVSSVNSLRFSADAGSGAQEVISSEVVVDGELFFWEIWTEGRATDAQVRGGIYQSGGGQITALSAAVGALGALDRIEVGHVNGANKLDGSQAGVALYQGVPDLFTRLRLREGCDPMSLATKPAHYWPLQGDYADRGTVGGITFTASGSPTWNTTDPAVAVLRDRTGASDCGAMQFSGSAYASLGSSLDNSLSCCIGAWFDVPIHPTSKETLIAFGGSANSHYARVQMQQATGEVRVQANDAGGVHSSGYSTSAVGGAGKTLVVLQLNGATDRKIFINGVEEVAATTSKSPSVDRTSVGALLLSSASQVVGSGGASGAFAIAGTLTAEQHAAIHAGADPRSVADLAGLTCSLLAPLGANYVSAGGATAHDLSGSGNALTITGSPTLTRGGGGKLAPAHAFGWSQGITHEALSNGKYALQGTSASDSFLEVPRAVVAGFPCEAHAGAKMVVAASNDYVLGIESDQDGVNRILLGQSGGAAIVYAQDSGGTATAGGSTGGDDAWHVVAVRGSDTDSWGVYVDGAQEDSDSADIDIAAANTDRLIIGAQNTGGGGAWPGGIQRIAVAAPLSDAQFARITSWIQRAYAGAA